MKLSFGVAREISLVTLVCVNAFLHLLSLKAASDSGAAGVENVDTVAMVMLALLGLIAGIGVGFVMLARYHVKKRREEEERLLSHFARFNPPGSSSRSIFGLPKCWLAIRSTNLQAVQEAFHLHNARSCSWEEGLAEATQQKLFISPPVGSWILVMGSCLPDPHDDVDRCFRFLVDLSQKMGHVQFFEADRVLYHHAWVRAENGRILRGYAWAGETVWNQGSRTIAETELGLQCLDYGENAGTDSFPPPQFIQTNTDKVVTLAANWSIDPLAVDHRDMRLGQGLAGEVSSPHSF